MEEMTQREAYREYQRKRYAQDPQKFSRYQAEYRRKHPEKWLLSRLHGHATTLRSYGYIVTEPPQDQLKQSITNYLQERGKL